MVAGNNADSAVATTVDEYKANRKAYARVEAGKLPDYYTVDWKNDDGSILKTKEFAAGTTPTYDGATPTKADDDNAYVYSTGFGTGESHAKSDRAIHVIPFLEFSFEPAAWEDGDLGDGVANVFRYAFDKPGDFGATSMLDIGFGADDMAVVKTPPVVNSAGFTYQVLASDNPAFDASGNVTAYDLDPSGATVIPETGKTARFFRLRAVEQ